MDIKTRYRARTEWFGIEIFDRQEGKVFAFDENTSATLFALLEKLYGNKAKNNKSFINLPEKLFSLELLKNDEPNIEPLINTPYTKTADFASAPRRIYWEFTRKCNLNCRACFNRFFLNEELSIQTILSIARQLYDAGVYEIRCTGGEPTVRNDFFEIAEELAQMGFYLSMGTNGIYPKEILQKVLNAPISWIILSIDGSNQSTYEEMRGSDHYPLVLRSLEHLAAKGCRLRVNTLIRKNHYKYEDIKGLAQLCDQFNVESLNCIPLRPVTKDPEVLKQQLTPIEFREFIRGLSRLREEHHTDFITTLDLRHTHLHDRIYVKDRSCAAGREGAVISPYGEIYGCSYSLASVPDFKNEKRKKYVAGNLLEEKFLAIWNDSKRWAIYRDLYKYKHDKCKKCDYYLEKRCIGNCPIMDKNNPAAFDPYCYLYVNG